MTRARPEDEYPLATIFQMLPRIVPLRRARWLVLERWVLELWIQLTCMSPSPVDKFFFVECIKFAIQLVLLLSALEARL